MRPHAHQAQRQMSCRIPNIETHRTLGELVGLDIVERCVIRPAQVSGVAEGDRQLGGRLRILCVYSQGAAKQRLRFDAIISRIAVKMPKPALIEFVGVACLWWPTSDAISLELEQFRLYRSGYGCSDLVLQLE